jgi:hypothetical protein
MNKEQLREQYCLEKGGINPSNIIEWYYIEWLEYKLTEALKQSDNSELLDALKWFCRRVDMGEVRSRNTYAKFRGLIEKHDKQNDV